MRRFNFSGRQKIKREDVRLVVNSQNRTLNCGARLTDYEFPDNANVYLEAQRQNRYMRFGLGSVVELDRRSHSLTEFDDLEGIQYSLKVVEANHGRLLGIVSQIKPSDDGDHDKPAGQGILPVRSTDLSDCGLLWRVDSSSSNYILEIEKGLGSKEQVVRSVFFRAFVLPAAMREILITIVASDWDETLSNPQDPDTAWLTYARDKCGGLPEKGDSLEDYAEWLDMTTRILSQRINVREKAIEEFGDKIW
jgi:hypothetical protein